MLAVLVAYIRILELTFRDSYLDFYTSFKEMDKFYLCIQEFRS